MEREPVIGFTCSVWDLLHAGHVEFLRECRARCDRLVVGLQTAIPDRPDKNQPVQTVLERFLVLRACRYVDEIVPYESEEDLQNLLGTLGPHQRFLGSDYGPEVSDATYKPITGSTLYFDPGYEIVFINRLYHNYSTSTLRKRVATAEGEKNDRNAVAEGGPEAPRDQRRTRIV